MLIVHADAAWRLVQQKSRIFSHKQYALQVNIHGAFGAYKCYRKTKTDAVASVCFTANLLITRDKHARHVPLYPSPHAQILQIHADRSRCPQL